MNWKIFLPLLFAVSLFVAGSTTALADYYRGHGRSYYGHRVTPQYKHYGHGHDYRWHKGGGRVYHHGRPFYGKNPNFRQPFAHHHNHPYRWRGGPFFGGTFFLPGWGVVFSGHGLR